MKIYLSTVCVALACMLVGCSGDQGAAVQSVTISKNDLANQVEGTWVAEGEPSTQPNGEVDQSFYKYSFKLEPTRFKHGTYKEFISKDGTQWELSDNSGSWTVLPSLGDDADNYKSKTNGKYDVRVSIYREGGGGAAELSNEFSNRVWVDFDGTSFVNTREGGGMSLDLTYKKQ